MAEFKRSRDWDWKYHAKKNDFPPPVELRKSVLEMRLIYKEMDDYAFCIWYAGRYKVKIDVVSKIIKAEGKS